MAIRDTVYTRCTSGHAGLAALIGLRCYAVHLPDEIIYPAIAYEIVSESDNDTRSHTTGNTDRAVFRVSFSCYDVMMPGAVAVADQLRAAWSGYSAKPTVGYAQISTQIDGFEEATNVFRVIVDVMIEHIK